MPWKVVGTTVVRSDTGEHVKTHKNRRRAVAHMRALYANVHKAHFDPNEPRDWHGRWMRVGSLIHDLEGAEKLPGAVRSAHGAMPRRRASHVVESAVERMKLPRKPRQSEVLDAQKWARQEFHDNTEYKYASMMLRLSRKGITQDPARRGEIRDRYGVPPMRQVEIERALYDHMFPQATVVPNSNRRRNLLGEASRITTRQREEMLNHGALRGYPLAAPESTHRPDRLFKATKGKYRGKWVVTDANGNSKVVSESRANKIKTESKSWWKNRNERSREQLKRSAERYREQQGKIKEGEIEREANSRAARIAQAKRWAKSVGLDESDSYWWGFYWNDPSLISNSKELGQQEDTSIPIKVGIPDVNEARRMDPKKLERILALPDISAADIRGHRPRGRKALKGDEDFVPAKDQKTNAAAEAAWKNWYEKQRKRAVREARKRGQVKKAHHFDPNEPRDFHGRWTTIGEVARVLVGDSTNLPGNRRNHTGSIVSRSMGKTLGVASAFDHERRSIKVKPPRPPRSAPLWYDGIIPDHQRIPNDRALYERNNGPNKITNQRLSEMMDILSGRKKGKITAKEKQLIASARGANNIDGKSSITYTKKDGSKRTTSRYDLIGQVAGKLTPGSGDRKQKRHQISDEARERANTKRRLSKKENSVTQQRKIDETFELFSLDNRTANCIFCGKGVKHSAMSLETAKPKLLGGKYEKGNMFPAHFNCNTSLGSANLSNNDKKAAEKYYEDMMKLFLKNYPPAVRKFLSTVYAKNRKHLGTYADAKRKGFK